MSPPLKSGKAERQMLAVTSTEPTKTAVTNFAVVKVMARYGPSGVAAPGNSAPAQLREVASTSVSKRFFRKPVGRPQLSIESHYAN